MKPAHVGCSGWNYRDWRERFYPKGLPTNRWLEHYSRRFATVEVNSTFYRLASRTAVERWVEQTPPGFLFSVKASRYMTHVKRLATVEDAIGRFHEPIEPLAQADKLGPVLWQLPENFHRDDERLGSALAALEKGPLKDGRHCFEFRHPSWFHADVYSLLRGHRAALVIGVHPERPFQSHEMTTNWTFVRFHYGERGRRGNYSVREVAEWGARIEEWRRNTEVFAYFNNDWKGFAIRNAVQLESLLKAADRDD